MNDQNDKKMFFSVIVEPINTLVEAKERCHFVYNFDRINESCVILSPVTKSKKIYLLTVDETILEGEEKMFFAKRRKKPITHAPNYLFGLIAKLEHGDFTKDFDTKRIVAFSLGSMDVFSIYLPFENFLYCYFGDGETRLRAVMTSGPWSKNSNYVFLAEDIDEEPE